MPWNWSACAASGAVCGDSECDGSECTVVLLLLSHDGIYCGNLFAPQAAVPSADWYKERVLTNVCQRSCSRLRPCPTPA